MENQNINQIPNNQNYNYNQDIEKKENDFRNIMLSIVGVFIILAAVSGGTYAYYAFNATNNTTITGTAATTELVLTVSKVSTDANGPMVPQPATTINKALVGTDNKTCVDGNGNTVCQVYKITITNNSTANTTVAGYIKFQNGSSSSFSNIYWLLLGQTGTTFTKYTDYSNIAYGVTSSTGTTLSTTTVATPVHGKVNTASGTANMDKFLTSTDLAVGVSKNYYITVWINETGSIQNDTDKGTFTGTIYFESANGTGLTSTFTA